MIQNVSTLKVNDYDIRHKIRGTRQWCGFTLWKLAIIARICADDALGIGDNSNGNYSGLSVGTYQRSKGPPEDSRSVWHHVSEACRYHGFVSRHFSGMNVFVNGLSSSNETQLRGTSNTLPIRIARYRPPMTGALFQECFNWPTYFA